MTQGLLQRAIEEVHSNFDRCLQESLAWVDEQVEV